MRTRPCITTWGMLRQFALLALTAWVGFSLSQPAYGLEQQDEQAAPRSARDVLERMRASLARLESIQFNAETKRVYYRDGKESRRTQVGLDFHWQANNHFYSASAFQSTDGQDSNERARTTGSSINDSTKRTRSWSCSECCRRVPYDYAHHLYAPFSFVLTEKSQVDIPSMLDPKLWDAIASISTLEEPTTVRAEPCLPVSYEVNPPGIEESVKIVLYAAQNLEYYPLRQTHTGKAGRSEMDVMSREVVETRKGKVVIPTHVVGKMYRGDMIQSVKEDFIDAKSLLVNHEIPPERFTIPRNLATRIRESKEP